MVTAEPSSLKGGAAGSSGSFFILNGKWTHKAGDLSRSAVSSLRMWSSGEHGGAAGLTFVGFTES